jgi:hypothetical protein
MDNWSYITPKYLFYYVFNELEIRPFMSLRQKLSIWNEKYWNVLFSTHLFVKTFYQVSDIPPQILIEAVTLGQVRNPRFKRLDFWLAADQIVHYLVKVGFVSSMDLL